MKIRLAKDRGTSRTSWLDSKHSFSFADYFDPSNTQFGALRVINEDVVKPSNGFGEHRHSNMEILTYVLSGELQHKDSMGNGSVIKPGSIQRMTAGTGVAHSEWNNSKDSPVHFLQIWVIPEKQGLTPSYEQLDNLETSPNVWHTIASNTTSDTGVFVNQDLVLRRATLTTDQKLQLKVNAGRKAWVQVISGNCEVSGVALGAGDALAIEEEGDFELTGSNAHVFWFDLSA